jgi:hypothetical protein
MTDEKAVHKVPYHLLRSLRLTTVFDNPGLHRGDVSEDRSRRLHLRTGFARGLGDGDGRRIRVAARELRTTIGFVNRRHS